MNLPVYGLAVTFGLAIGLHGLPDIETTYDLEVTTLQGMVFVIDHDLSRDDCQAAMDKIGHGVAGVACMPRYAHNR